MGSFAPIGAVRQFDGGIALTPDPAYTVDPVMFGQLQMMLAVVLAPGVDIAEQLDGNGALLVWEGTRRAPMTNFTPSLINTELARLPVDPVVGVFRDQRPRVWCALLRFAVQDIHLGRLRGLRGVETAVVSDDAVYARCRIELYVPDLKPANATDFVALVRQALSFQLGRTG